MEKIKIFLKYLQDRHPFALTRFNDGEIRGVINVGDTVARGCQKVTEDLSQYLRDALVHVQKDYWIGIPCPVCFPRYNRRAMEIVSSYDNLTCAVVNTNRNLDCVWNDLPEILNGRIVTWVSGEDQDLTKLCQQTGIRADFRRSLPVKNAWSHYNRIKDLYKNFLSGSVVILSCGPMAEVLIHQWYMKRPDVTFLDLGSTFDPFTRDVWHRCHKGTLPSCSYCN